MERTHDAVGYNYKDLTRESFVQYKDHQMIGVRVEFWYA